MEIGPRDYSLTLDAIWPTTNIAAWPDGSTYVQMYNEIRKFALPNYLGARITVPSALNLNAWEAALSDYQDSEITQFLRYGWPSSYTARAPPTPTLENHNTAGEYATHVDSFVDKETRLGAMLGPFHIPPFVPWTQTSPVLTRPKRNSSERRIIVDLSFPPQGSVNAGILPRFFQGERREYTLPSIENLISRVQLLGPSCFIWKADLSRAYRQLRIDPLDAPLLGIYHRGAYYLDVCPPFGCRYAASACQRTTNAVAYLMGKRGYHTLAYVDDFCGAEGTYKAACDSYATFERITEQLGLALAPDKCAFPSTHLEWLGYVVDTVAMTVTIPQDKMKEVLEECATWRTEKHASKRRIQSLVGKLTHISKCVRPGRKFISRILATLRALPEGGLARISDEFRADIRWFELYAQTANGIVLIVPTLEVEVIECDSCLTGGGGHSSKDYYSTVYTSEHRGKYPNITLLEAINLIIAYRTLSPAFGPGKKVLILTDNTGSKCALETGRTHDPILAACARELWLEAAKQTHEIEIRHKPGAELILADALSRRHGSLRMHNLAASLTAQYCLHEVPANISDHFFTPDL